MSVDDDVRKNGRWCVNCRWHGAYFSVMHACKHPLAKRDLVTGLAQCAIERADVAACGPRAMRWEIEESETPPPTRRFWEFWK